MREGPDGALWFTCKPSERGRRWVTLVERESTESADAESADAGSADAGSGSQWPLTLSDV